MSKIIKVKEKLPDGFIFWGDDLNFERPDLGLGEYKGTVTKIMNACRKSIVENDLSIYINSSALSEILRMKGTVKIRKTLANISDEDKLKSGILINNSEYICFGEVMKLISKELEGIHEERKRIYLRVSEQSLINMREANELNNIKKERYRVYKKEVGKLKSKRKKMYGVKFDELTGEKLKLIAHFSHIRSKASYPKLALNIDNGLLVNPETHKIITKFNIENEDQLEKLCIDKGWNLDWKEIFMSKIY